MLLVYTIYTYISMYTYIHKTYISDILTKKPSNKTGTMLVKTQRVQREVHKR